MRAIFLSIYKICYEQKKIHNISQLSESKKSKKKRIIFKPLGRLNQSKLEPFPQKQK